MLTLNFLKYKLVAFFENHKQVNQTVYNDKFTFASMRNLLYPVVNIEFEQSAVQDKFLVHSWNIFIGDKIHPDDTNSGDEIISDATNIAEDFFSFFRNDYTIDLKQTSNFQQVSDSFGDRVAGIVFTISINVLRLYNPTVMPAISNIAPVSQFISYWGWVDSNTSINILADIQALQYNGLFVDQGDILADFTSNANPEYLVFAEPINQPIKKRWYVSTNNNGTIGINTDDLFLAPVTIGSYRYYMTAYKTQQQSGLIIFKNTILP